MAKDNDITNTNGAPKEYWEARARKEKEEAESIAYRRELTERNRRFAIRLMIGIFVFCIIMLVYAMTL